MKKQRSFGVKTTPKQTKQVYEANPYSVNVYNLIVRRMDAIKKEVLSIVKEIEVENEQKRQLNLGVEE